MNHLPLGMNELRTSYYVRKYIFHLLQLMVIFMPAKVTASLIQLFIQPTHDENILCGILMPGAIEMRANG